MTNDAIRDDCLSLPHVTEAVRWAITCCSRVGGKMFAIIELDGHSCRSKCTPERYREQAPIGHRRDPHLPRPLVASERKVPMKHCLLIAVIVLCAASFGCARAGALSDQDKAAIQKVHDDFAQAFTAEKPDFAALVKASYAQDAQVLMPNMPAFTGEEAIAKAFSAGPSFSTFAIRAPFSDSSPKDFAKVRDLLERAEQSALRGAS